MMSARDRAVQFSQCDPTTIPRNGIQDALVYSEGDILQFRHDAVRIARNMRELLANNQVEDINQDDLYECIGIEKYLTNGVARGVQRRIAAHTRAILVGQHHLNKNDLATLSSNSSRLDIERAVNSATNRNYNE